MADSKLFQPINVGTQTILHRVVLAPMTRTRASKGDHVPINPLMKTYYSQRASRPGTLLFTEATLISPQAGGYECVPGIWSQDQIAAWKEITNAVHSNGSYIYLQMWALGRAAPMLNLEGGLSLVGPSPISIDPENAKYGTPRALTIDEIQEYVQTYAQAAKNAVEGAGFDGVDVHCGNGFLLDQFLQSTSNQRSDQYGGSVENRSRFPLQVVEAVVNAVGQERAGVRISPWSAFQGMRMEDPIPQFTHFISTLRSLYPNLAYLHVIESDVPGRMQEDSNDFLREIWSPKTFIACGGYTRETAMERADTQGNLIAFGQLFISNPDLPTRLEKNIPLAAPNPATFYGASGEDGYINYSFAELSEED
ncbi:hypothetical protein BDZ97DRAFT_2044428 [Flammula alnicola]|nr:hypothetical protein BDZ97DRAFT_2044428 [Flammula alnicola]